MITSVADPLYSFRFQVEIDGLLVAGFSDVSGLEAQTEIDPYHEGGVNDFEHHFIKYTKHPKLVLKRGATGSRELWDWYDDVTAGIITRKNGSIILLDEKGDEACRWNFFNSFPVRWIGPDLKGSQSNVAIETIELVHTGLQLA
ncbi:MAG: phage tail protein [Firmicutes bacterium]|nr:phage tail protein [Bacillota bacterium]